MTPTEINIAIAESLPHIQKPIYRSKDMQWGGVNKGTYIGHVPKYHSSLDACAEFEWHMDEQTFSKYTHTLQSVIAGKEIPRDEYLKSTLSSSKMAIRANAPQRCEAYLRTIGMWKDAQ